MQLSSRALGPSTVSTPATFPATALPPVPDSAPARQPQPSCLDSPSASDWSISSSKRLLDLSVALLVLALFAIPMLVIALCVRLSSPGPALFVQQRMGRGGRLFRIYKFRSMTCYPGQSGPGLTRDGDRRITGLGRWLRKLKLDELPQFYNILRGEMSLVGPRPKLPRYVAITNMPYRPGITGAATLAFRREEEILSRIHPSQLENFYNRRIRLLKGRMDARYMCRASFWSDARLIGATFLACVLPARIPAAFRNASAQIIAFPLPPAKQSSVRSSFETAN
jgi:lipopolysaccharide/colanic/teichoic acid biosynthesis glycosyltransferase